ncbi:hypothetical protein AAFF_G00091720 [Aldrovandia affinis]|uniref:Shisa N-terminal domain-containing protein n=1 Tax=Aldrovandia affinis TaxID=143900 RepID=A0AAD7T2J8_9TELE|nr:hypothetical protein AAFF_G00091720 [Aldrovandia affinis]
MQSGSFHMSVTVVMTLLLAIIDVKASGEYCHGWHDSQGTWREGFQCPERFDSGDAIICCGKCELRYCCTSTEARLDQGACENDKQTREPGSDSKENKDNGAALELKFCCPHEVAPIGFQAAVPRAIGSGLQGISKSALTQQGPVLQNGSSVGARGMSDGRIRVQVQSNWSRPLGMVGAALEALGAGRLLETIPMMASTGTSRGSSSRQSSTATSSSSSAQSSARPPALLHAQAGCCLPPDTGVYVNMPPNFSLLSCQQAAQILHPQYIGYALQHEAIAPSPAPFLHPPTGYRPLQSPFPPLTNMASEPKHPLMTMSFYLSAVTNQLTPTAHALFIPYKFYGIEVWTLGRPGKRVRRESVRCGDGPEQAWSAEYGARSTEAQSSFLPVVGRPVCMRDKQQLHTQCPPLPKVLYSSDQNFGKATVGRGHSVPPYPHHGYSRNSAPQQLQSSPMGLWQVGQANSQRAASSASFETKFAHWRSGDSLTCFTTNSCRLTLPSPPGADSQMAPQIGADDQGQSGRDGFRTASLTGSTAQPKYGVLDHVSQHGCSWVHRPRLQLLNLLKQRLPKTNVLSASLPPPWGGQPNTAPGGTPGQSRLWRDGELNPVSVASVRHCNHWTTREAPSLSILSTMFAAESWFPIKLDQSPPLVAFLARADSGRTGNQTPVSVGSVDCCQF